MSLTRHGDICFLVRMRRQICDKITRYLEGEGFIFARPLVDGRVPQDGLHITRAHILKRFSSCYGTRESIADRARRRSLVRGGE